MTDEKSEASAGNIVIFLCLVILVLANFFCTICSLQDRSTRPFKSYEYAVVMTVWGIPILIISAYKMIRAIWTWTRTIS